jgi:hypothetical protein
MPAPASSTRPDAPNQLSWRNVSLFAALWGRRGPEIVICGTACMPQQSILQAPYYSQKRVLSVVHTLKVATGLDAVQMRPYGSCSSSKPCETRGANSSATPISSASSAAFAGPYVSSSTKVTGRVASHLNFREEQEGPQDIPAGVEFLAPNYATESLLGDHAGFSFTRFSRSSCLMEPRLPLNAAPPSPDAGTYQTSLRLSILFTVAKP